MYFFKKFFLIILILGISSSLFARNNEAIEAGGTLLGLGLGLLICHKTQHAHIENTRCASLNCWLGGQKRICRACYESTPELKQRVELTALMALDLQNRGYTLREAVETAKLTISMEHGGCYVPCCGAGPLY